MLHIMSILLTTCQVAYTHTLNLICSHILILFSLFLLLVYEEENHKENMRIQNIQKFSVAVIQQQQYIINTWDKLLQMRLPTPHIDMSRRDKQQTLWLHITCFVQLFLSFRLQ